MNELIKIEEKEGKRVVNARDLHQFLEVGRDFSNWIKNRIEKYDFIENQDFIVFAKNGENLNGGRPSIEYAISIDMAKELSMVENNEKGRMARRYFIECEKKLKEVMFGSQIPRTFAEALRLAADQQEKIEQQQKQLAEQQPKVVLADAFTASSGSFPLKDLATILSQRGVDIGPNRLHKYLRENHYIGERGDYRNVAYQKYVDQGLFEIDMAPNVNAYGSPVVNRKTMVTPKGIQYFVNKFLNNKNNK